MTYRYKLLYAPQTLDEFARAFRGMCYSCDTFYASFRTQEKECGRPIKGLRKPRWFDEKRNPDQLWLPFKAFTPVPMYPPMQRHPNRWHCEFAVSDTTIYQAILNTNSHRPERNTLLALEVYWRELVREEPPRPFGGSQAEDRLQRRGRSQDRSYGQQLSTVRRNTALRNHIERDVSRLINADGATLTSRGYFYNTDGERVAQFLSVEFFNTTRACEYHVYVDFPHAPYVIIYQEPRDMVPPLREAADAFRVMQESLPRVGNLL